MTLRNLFTINAIVSLSFGAGFLIMPKAILSLYGIVLDDAGIFLARLTAAEFLSYAAITWLARNIDDTAQLRIILIGCLVGFGIGFFVALFAQLSGLLNFIGWSTVMTYFLFTVGYAYFYVKMYVLGKEVE